MESDRDYFYLATTLHAGSLPRAEVIERLEAAALPTWQQLARDGHIRTARCFAKVGEIEMKTDGTAVRPWDYLALLEVTPDSTADTVAALEWDGLRQAGLDGDPDVAVLSREILRRPAGSGTAVPRPSPLLDALPAHFTTGVEYIDIPDEHWDDYDRFMRDVFGPVGRLLVERGQAHQVIITERVRSLLRDPTLPAWNRVHVLVSDFDGDPGFFAASTQAVRDVLGAGQDVFEALGAVDHYRRKPCMSKNITLAELSVGEL